MPAILYNDIFNSNEEAQEFLDAVLCFEVLLKHEIKEKDVISEEGIVKAINLVSDLIGPINEENDLNLNRLFHSVEEENLLSFINPQKILKEGNPSGKKSYFTFLNKSWDEDFYSDHLSSILNTSFSNNFQHYFLKAIIKNIFNIEIDTTGMKSFREISLLNFNYEDAPQMRMDLFIKFNANKVVIIENKTKTHEHSSQTQHYYNACLKKYDERDIFPIILSPSGFEAECKAFKSFSYKDLFFILSQSLEQHPLERKELELLIDFYQELKEQFYDPYNKSIKRAQDFRRKNG